jgi:hypothetical protein
MVAEIEVERGPTFSAVLNGHTYFSTIQPSAAGLQQARDTAPASRGTTPTGSLELLTPYTHFSRFEQPL